MIIQQKFKGNLHFKFEEICRDDIRDYISKLNANKANQGSDIPTRLIKENSELFADFLISNFNYTIREGLFPDILKLADVTPVFKEGSINLKENYRPVSILPNIFKIFERPLFDQLNHFDSILSPYQCGFRKVIVHSIV